MIIKTFRRRFMINFVSRLLNCRNCNVIVMDVFLNLNRDPFMFIPYKCVRYIFFDGPASLRVLVRVTASSFAKRHDVFRGRLVDALRVRVVRAARPEAEGGDKDIVAVRRNKRMTIALLAFIGGEPGSIDDRVKEGRACRCRFITVVIPGEEIDMVIRTIVRCFTASVDVFVVRVTARDQPFGDVRRDEVGRSLFAFHTAYGLGLKRRYFPDHVNFFYRLYGAFIRRFNLRVRLDVLCARGQRADLRFREFGAFTISGARRDRLVFIIFCRFRLTCFVINLDMGMSFAVTVLVAHRHVVIGLLGLPVASVVVEATSICRW